MTNEEKQADVEISLYNGEEDIIFKPDSHRYYLLDKENLTKAGTPKKVSLPGVTTILGVIDKPALIGWAVNLDFDYFIDLLSMNDSNQIDFNLLHQFIAESRVQHDIKKTDAGNLGNVIHDWIEMHIKGEAPEMPEDENVKRGAISFLDWESEQESIKYLESEKIVYSRKHKYIGRLDVVAKIDGKIYLLDLKTGNSIWPEHSAQVAAYLKADVEENGTKYDGRIILRISKETEEEYEERMKKKPWFVKAREKDPESFPYLPFEAVYLDEDGSTVHEDFAAFKHAQGIYNWHKRKNRKK